jgi:AraC-like DNA-binding protein
METIKTFEFKSLPIEIEVKNLRFVKELPNLLGLPHKATFYQIVWLTQGQAVFHIDFRDITIKENEVLIISAGQVCQFDIDSHYSGKLILFTGSFFSVTETDANLLHTAEMFNPVNLNKTAPICPQLMGSLSSLLEEELNQKSDRFQTAIAQSYLRVILLETERQIKTTHTPLQSSIGRRFCNAVEEHFKESHNTEFYVQLLGLNEKKLSKEIKAMTGKTPKAYIDWRIILEANRMLSYSSLSAKEIGFYLGFDEPTNFAKYFRKHTGTTPSQFRIKTRQKSLS